MQRVGVDVHPDAAQQFREVHPARLDLAPRRLRIAEKRRGDAEQDAGLLEQLARRGADQPPDLTLTRAEAGRGLRHRRTDERQVGVGIVHAAAREHAHTRRRTPCR